MIVQPLCGFCCRRDAVQIDEDDRVPICAECRDEPTPEPKRRLSSPLHRVLSVIRRDPGLTVDDISERLCIEKPRVSEILSRLIARGDIRFEGKRRSRSYYERAPRSQNHEIHAHAAA